jgi:hypothetical protein
LLRDNISLTRQAYVEFDLEAMMAGEAYPDFVLLWLLLHQSRFEAERPDQYDLWFSLVYYRRPIVVCPSRPRQQRCCSKFGVFALSNLFPPVRLGWSGLAFGNVG